MIYSPYLCLLLFCLVSCTDLWEYSPNQKFDKDSARDVNKNALKRLAESTPDDTIVIAFVGDSQRFYDHIGSFVKSANAIPEIDFTLLAGDISDFGLLQEFELVHEGLSELDKPYLAVIGNHDILANGESIFMKMFGPLNESFIYDSVKFILHNTNSREYTGNNVPDLNWLSNELKTSPDVRHYVTVSHVPPFSGDFNPDLEIPYAKLLNETPDLLISLHGHNHSHADYYPYEDGIRYLTGYSFDKRSFVLLKIVKGEVFKRIINY
jgi:hypothetical protein